MFRGLVRPGKAAIGRLGVGRLAVGRSAVGRSAVSPICGNRFVSGSGGGFQTDGFNWGYFLLVGIFGTAVFVKLANKIKDQDNHKTHNNKLGMSEADWEAEYGQHNKRTFPLNEGQEYYVVPYASQTEGKTKELVKKLGGPETVCVIDLNKLLQHELEDASSKYGVLLNDTLDREDNSAPGCWYEFSYRLAPGVFTAIVRAEVVAQHKAHPEYTRFVLLNYPNTIAEAVRFEQKVGLVTKLVCEGGEPTDSKTVDYFKTVNKVVNVKDMKQMEPKKLTVKKPAASASAAASDDTSYGIVVVDPLSIPPADDAPAIQKAQYQLRQMHEPIRKYGESDQDVINRLSELQKK